MTNETHPLTVTEQHPTGVTAAIATPLAIVITYLVNLIPGANMSPEVAAAFAALIIAIPTVIASWKTPRITIPDLPEAIEERGINTGPGDVPVTDAADTPNPGAGAGE